jgi:hypothetical protein
MNDQLLSETFSSGWHYIDDDSRHEVFFYNSIDCTGWFLISYEPSIYGYLPSEGLSVDVDVSITKTVEREISLDTTEDIDVDNLDYLVLKAECEKDHLYRLVIEHLDYSTYVIGLSVYNETGHSYFDVRYLDDWRPQGLPDNGIFYDFHAVNNGTYAISIQIIGDGSIRVRLNDITVFEQSIVVQPDMILVIGAGGIALLVGLFLGRVSLFGSKSELHKP